MAEWVNKGNFPRDLAHTQCLRRDFVMQYFCGVWRIRDVSVATLLRNIFAGFCAYAMSPSRLCYAVFLRGLAHTRCLRRDAHGVVQVLGTGSIATNKPKNAHQPFINAYNHRMCTLNVYGSTGNKQTNKQTNKHTLAFYKGIDDTGNTISTWTKYSMTVLDRYQSYRHVRNNSS